MKTFLSERWTVQALTPEARQILPADPVPATVPGSVHTDLLTAGLIPDPYLADHEDSLRWIGHTDWKYATTFDAEPPAVGERVDLVFEGLDTIALIELNGHEVARTVNMHRSYRFDVRDLLVVGENRLVVSFSAPIEAALRLSAEQGARPHVNSYPYNAIRKMACNYGWDWGPELVTSGIWKPVYLDRWSHVRIAGVRPLITMRSADAELDVHVDLEWAGPSNGLSAGLSADAPVEVVVTVAGEERHVVVAPGQPAAVLAVEVAAPDLWWPRGYGLQPLYPLIVCCSSGGSEVDRWKQEIGFRTVALDTTPEPDGSAFTLVVNGRPVFALGADWIPDDCFPHRIDRARYGRRIDQAVAAGMNLLRVWGGGIYESEDFYALCDQAGLLVWQDFLFACAAYPEEEPMRGEVIAEAREAVTRLSSHPSLAVWNGNNENFPGYHDWGWKERLGDLTWGLGYYTDILPAIVAELDPTRPYSAGSPSSPSPDLDPNDQHHGTMHIWDVWNKLDYRAYANYVPRFLSEFGFQGPPTWATLTRAIDADQLSFDSPQMLLHQKADDGNAKLAAGLADHLPAPASFEDWHWATSLNQARAVQFGIEHFRSNAPRCAGTVVWQLNDCWPVTSWAAIDGDGRLKPLYFALRHSYADRLLTVQPRPAGLSLVAINNTDAEWQSTALIRRTDLGGAVLAEQKETLQVPARGTATLPLENAVAVADQIARELISADVDDQRASFFFAEDRASELAVPDLQATASAVPGGYRVQVRALNLVKDLALLVDRVDPDAEVDDQLVTLLPGETVVFRVRSAVAFDPELLLSPAVLRSANQLLSPRPRG
ncbi:beta-mannosidase [Nakamurella sp. UYEF19]|uniref:glycoside hydrolase family 2 protein n=1 Tax=Nakamurella sp. UYEF19 TaxID=1756392 RepID=UPI003390CBD1